MSATAAPIIHMSMRVRDSIAAEMASSLASRASSLASRYAMNCAMRLVAATLRTFSTARYGMCSEIPAFRSTSYAGL